MREYVEYVNIAIIASADAVDELDMHLSMNGYDFGIDRKRNILFVNMEEVAYVETILEDRKIEFETLVHWF